MYSFPNFEPVRCSMSGSNCCFFICTQVSKESSRVVWYSHLFKIFHSWLWSTQQVSRVNEAEVVFFFLECPCFLYDPTNVGNLISGSSAFSKSTCTSGSSQFTYCWSLAWKILSITLLVCEMSEMYGNLNILWHCLSLGLGWKLTFSSSVATAEFSKLGGMLRAALLQHHLLGFEIAQLEFHHLHLLCSYWCFLSLAWHHILECDRNHWISARGRWQHMSPLVQFFFVIVTVKIGH